MLSYWHGNKKKVAIDVRILAPATAETEFTPLLGLSMLVGQLQTSVGCNLN